MRQWLILTAILASAAFSSAAAAKGKKQGGVIRLEVTTIEGRVQKPNAFFINTRRAMVYKSMEIKESFLPRIIEAVETERF